MSSTFEIECLARLLLREYERKSPLFVGFSRLFFPQSRDQSPHGRSNGSSFCDGTTLAVSRTWRFCFSVVVLFCPLAVYMSRAHGTLVRLIYLAIG